MPTLLITYDLNKPGQDYDALYEKIRGLGTWWHYLDSTWIVVSTMTPNQATDRLKSVIDSSDSLLVIDITGDSYQGWLEQGAWDWLRKHV